MPLFTMDSWTVEVLPDRLQAFDQTAHEWITVPIVDGGVREAVSVLGAMIERTVGR